MTGPSAETLRDALYHVLGSPAGARIKGVFDYPGVRDILARADAQPRLVAALVRAALAATEASADSFTTRVNELLDRPRPDAGAVCREDECGVPINSQPGWHCYLHAKHVLGNASKHLGHKPTEASAGAVERCAGDHEFQPITCSRCGAHGNVNLSIVGEDERLDITKKVRPTESAAERVDDRMAERCAIDGHRWVSIGPGQSGCLWCVATEPRTPPTRCAAHGQDHSDGCPAEMGDGK